MSGKALHAKQAGVKKRKMKIALSSVQFRKFVT